MPKLLHALGLTGPSLGRVQLYKTKSGTLHGTEVRKVQYLLDISTLNTFKPTGCPKYIFTFMRHEFATILHIEDDRRIERSVVYNCALANEGPVWPETCRGLLIRILLLF